jgi:hypothetical protein
MGLISDVQVDLKDAFDNELADVVVPIALIKKDAIGEYDVTSGKMQSYCVSYPSRGIFSAYPSNKVDGTNIRYTDEMLLIIANEIEVALEIDDIIVLEDDTRYLVVKPNSILGGGSVPITYEAQVRKNA